MAALCRMSRCTSTFKGRHASWPRASAAVLWWSMTTTLQGNGKLKQLSSCSKYSSACGLPGCSVRQLLHKACRTNKVQQKDGLGALQRSGGGQHECFYGLPMRHAHCVCPQQHALRSQAYSTQRHLSSCELMHSAQLAHYLQTQFCNCAGLEHPVGHELRAAQAAVVSEVESSC